MEPGITINKSLNIVFFGFENEEKKISASVEYRFAGSNAIFVKTKIIPSKFPKLLWAYL